MEPYRLKGHGHCTLKWEVRLLAGASMACEQALSKSRLLAKMCYRVWAN